MLKYLYKKNEIINSSKFKRTFIALFLLSFLFFGCTENNNVIEPQNSVKKNTLHKGSGYTDPYLTGTFVDFWYKSTWSVSQWEDQMEEMELVGVEKIIVQYSAYNQYIWCYSPNDYSSEAYINALPNLLYAAALHGIDVYVGLYFDDEFWSNTNNASILQTHAQRCNDLADDIWSQYSGYTSFAGWYISHEPAPYYYDTDAKFNVIKNNLINPVANHCKSISGKPVAISAFFNENLTTSNGLLYFMNRLGGCDVDIIMLQDGTGSSEDGVTPHCSINNVQTYFNDANWGLYGENPEYQGDFWADVETFKPDDTPETFETVEQKLNIVDGYVTEIMTYQYFKDMAEDSPHTGAAQDAADTLRTKYQQYYYEW